MITRFHSFLFVLTIESNKFWVFVKISRSKFNVLGNVGLKNSEISFQFKHSIYLRLISQ